MSPKAAVIHRIARRARAARIAGTKKCPLAAGMTGTKPREI
jgi:hypothetical protein